MLRGQYGTATPSSLAPVFHPEDAQPNEGINRRSHKLPPTIRNSSARGQATSIHYRGLRGRGGYRGANMSQGGRGGQQIQYAIRGNSAWRRGRSINGHPNRTPKIADDYASSSSASSSGGGTPRSPLRDDSRDKDSSCSAQRRIQDSTTLSSSQTSATPPRAQDNQPSRNWMVRSRSPSPKLPATPLKRRKVEEALPLPSSSQMPPPPAISRLPLPGRTRKVVEPIKQEIVSPAVKQEVISPSPPRPERRLITESCKFFPFPDSCKKSDANYQQNRRSFFLEKNRELVFMGLKRTKAFARDDGLVIEWSSPVPVWSDTLHPEVMDLASAIRQAHQVNHKLSSHNRPLSAARPRSQSSDGPPSLQSKRIRRSPSPKTTMKVEAPPQITPSPTPNPQHGPKKRLPLPGRRSMNPKPVTVPVAFSPRRSTTPTSISKSTLMNLLKQNDAVGGKPSFSDKSSQPKSIPLVQTPDHRPVTYPALEAGGLSPNMKQEDEDFPLTVLHGSRQTTPIISSSNNAPPDSKITPTPNMDDSKMVDSDSLDAENVATSLLTRSRDNLPSDEEVEVDVSTDDDGSNEIEGLVSDYLQRYCQLFDSDRSKLEMAYDRNALFSCRVHHQEEPSFSMAGLFAPEVETSFHSLHSRASASTVDQGRTQISNRLLSMGPYQFCPRGVTGHLLYDAVDSAAGILLTVHGEVVNPHISNPHMDHVLTLDQSFVLRQRGLNVQPEQEGDAIDRLEQHTPPPWPLVAISHQMTVRAAPLLSTERLEEDLPWIRDISHR